jgi:hypothetical protein
LEDVAKILLLVLYYAAKVMSFVKKSVAAMAITALGLFIRHSNLVCESLKFLMCVCREGMGHQKPE